jgi:predicted amidohydrolase YtcJ
MNARGITMTNLGPTLRVAILLASLTLLLAACGAWLPEPDASSNSELESDVASSVKKEEGENSESQDPDPADLILAYGRIYTGNANQPWAEAAAVRNGEIVFVGSSEAVRVYEGPDTRSLDLDRKLVLPGMQDSHAHILEAGSPVAGTCILDPDTAPEQFVQRLKRCAPKQIGTDWVLGWGHSLHALLESDRLPIDILDEAIPDRPAIMMEETSHSVWVNSAALEAAGIDDDSPDPPAGIYDRDPDTGELTGILYENAGNMMFDLALAPSPELDELNYEGLLYGLEEAAKNGITSVADARAYWDRGHIETWKRADREEALTARVTLSLWAYPHYDDDEQLEKLASLFERDEYELLNISQIKMYSDGILHSATAALLEPYDETLGVTGDRGMNYFDAARLERYITELERVGFDMHIHAIGDRAVRESLDAIEGAQASNGPEIGARHRLTHLEMIHEDDRKRFAELGVIADFQVAGNFTLPAFASDMEPLIGERAFDMVPVRSIYDTGAVVTLSSDWDVSSLSPFVGMQNALQREEESLPNLEAAVEAYTQSPAYLMRREDKTGSLEVGKLADMIVVDQDIFRIPVDNIGKTQVLLTLLGGEEVYRAEGFVSKVITLPPPLPTAYATTPVPGSETETAVPLPLTDTPTATLVATATVVVPTEGTPTLAPTRLPATPGSMTPTPVDEGTPPAEYFRGFLPYARTSALPVIRDRLSGSRLG